MQNLASQRIDAIKLLGDITFSQTNMDNPTEFRWITEYLKTRIHLRWALKKKGVYNLWRF